MVRVLVRLVALVVLVMAVGCRSPAPASTVTRPAKEDAAKSLHAPLPLDPRITTGKLDNGLTYFVLPNKKPEKRAQLWLAINAGSILEDDDQRGLAHFVEHMCFNGTRRFPKASIIDLVERSGVRFGADLNASTSFDETIYKLQVPTDDPKLLTTGITVLRDWADGVSFEPEEVEKERGVVLEEWRLKRGAGRRLYEQQAPIVFNGSKYAVRQTIGLPEIIKTAPREALVRYYRDWYRPDLMAVVAVGDFRGSDVEALIKKEFASLANPRPERPRPFVEIPAYEKPIVTIDTDPELSATTVSITSAFPHRPRRSADDFRRRIAERLFNGMLNARLDEVRRQPDPPFLGASSASSRMVRTTDSFRQSATVKEDAVLAGFEALMEEVSRVERHGFTAGELERAKSRQLRSYQQSAKEEDREDSRGLVNEVVQAFLHEESLPGPRAELTLAEKMIPALTLAELNGIGKELSKGNRVIAVAGPPNTSLPSSAQLLAMKGTVEARPVAPYEEPSVHASLMDAKPKPGSVVATTSYPAVGVTEWTLANGARVVVRPTTFANDEVRFAAFAPGGTSLARDEDFESARFADVVVRQGGIGNLDATTLRRTLNGKLVTVSARIGELDAGMGGQASATDLEAMMQLIHLGFVAPRRDESAFRSWRTRELANVKNRRATPEAVFSDEMTVLQTQSHPRKKPVTTEMIQKVDLDKAFTFYKDRFADASGFTFIFVGSFAPDTHSAAASLARIKALAETYLGSLPSTGKKETWRDVRVAWPSGVQTKTVRKGSEPKASVSLTFHGADPWSRDAESDMHLLGDVLKMRLREVLREDMGGTYGVGASGSLRRRPQQDFTFGVRFGCAPENVDKLVKAVFDEAKTLKDKGVGEDYIAKIKELRRRTHETSTKDNGFWLRELERAYVFGDDMKHLGGPPIEPTSDRVKAAARTYLPSNNYVLGVLLPE